MKKIEASFNRGIRETNVIGLILGAIACVCCAIYLAGEIAEFAGELYKEWYLLK